MQSTVLCLLLVFSAGTLCSSQNAQFCWTEGTRRLEVRSHGAIEFADDDRGVKSLSPGGYFRVEEDYLLVFRGRRYQVTADAAGRLSRTYFDHDRAKPLDAQGEAWLMGIMPEIIRKTGLGAVPRLQRILKQGGPSAALSEISRIRDDEPKRIYLQELIVKGNLETSQLSSAMLQARKIGSDEEKADLLISIASYFLKRDLRQAIFQVAATIGSDEEHGRVLSALLQRDPSSESLKLAAKSAARIGSDEEKAKILTEIAAHNKSDRDVGRTVLNIAKSIGSDEERHHVLSAVLAGAGSDPEIAMETLHAAAGIGSDEEKAAVLIEAAPHYAEGNTWHRAFFDVTSTIGSDQQRRRVLSALMSRPGLGDVTFAAIARCARSLGSDEDKAAVLTELASRNLRAPAVRGDFFEAVNGIGSGEERKKVLLSIVHHAGVSPEIQAEAIKSARQIGSDEDKAAVLASLAGSDFQDERVRDAFFAATDSIGSDDERARILSVLLSKPGLARDTLIHAIESAARTSSDEVKANLLRQAAGTAHANDPQVRSALQKALDSIQSDSEYRRASAAFSKNSR